MTLGATAAFALFSSSTFAAGAHIATWVCYLDAPETRYLGEPLQATGKTQESALAKVLQDCETVTRGSCAKYVDSNYMGCNRTLVGSAEF